MARQGARSIAEKSLRISGSFLRDTATFDPVRLYSVQPYPLNFSSSR